MNLQRLAWLGCGLMLAAGAFWLWSSDNRGFLAYGVLLLCPLLHLLMMRGHGHQPAKEPGEEKRKGSCH